MSKYKNGDKAVIEITGEYQMKFLDLFAGIGGFQLGMEQAGNSVTVPIIKAIAENMEVFN